jgi:hypothetical protein
MSTPVLPRWRYGGASLPPERAETIVQEPAEDFRSQHERGYVFGPTEI